MADNTSRRVSSIVNLDILDPLIEAMLDGVFAPGAGNVSVELNFIPFMVGEHEMDHQWHPGAMDVDYEDGEEDKEDEEDADLYREEAEEGDNDDGVEDEESEIRHRHHHYGLYTSQEHGEDEEEEEVEEEEGGEGEEEETNEAEYDYDVGDEDEIGLDDGEEDDDDDEESILGLEDDDDDDEDDVLGLGYIDDSVLSNYGSLGWSICHNISHRKILLGTFNSRDFLRQMIDFFFTHLKQQTNLASTVSLQLLLTCLPTLVELKNLIVKTKYTMKEAVVIKVVLELYESYYKTFGAPTFKVYHTEVIPLLLDFYNRLPDAALKLMSKQLTRVLLNLNHLLAHFKTFNTKQEYIEHYRDTTRRMRNLSECIDSTKFFR